MTNTWMAWTVLAMALWLVEVLNPTNFYFACVGVGAAVTALASLAVADKGLLWNIFFAASALALVATRPLARRVRRAPSRPANVDAMIGRRVRVVEAIDPARGTGAVFVDGERWLAGSEAPIPESRQVEIMRIEGTRVIVRSAGG